MPNAAASAPKAARKNPQPRRAAGIDRSLTTAARKAAHRVAGDSAADAASDAASESAIGRNKDVARQVGLRHVSDGVPGIGREPAGDGFRYRDAKGALVKDAATLARIKALVIPPAWREVWICAQANGHIQATGRDVKGRKQYRYHAKWRNVRDDAKYERMRNFGRALPVIRQQVASALALPGLPREKILATVVHLLQETMIRIGNEEYARTNHSFGLTTLRNRHVDVAGAEVRFAFRGKSGVDHAIRLRDRRMAAIIRRMRELPGQELFQYLDEDGARHAIDSADVNAFLREISGEDYTAKDFRTWSGTLHAALELHRLPPFDSETEARRNVGQAIAAVAKKLGNTPAICRKCYVHPLILDTYLAGESLLVACDDDSGEPASRKPSAKPTGSSAASQTTGLDADELAVLALLEKQLPASS